MFHLNIRCIHMCLVCKLSECSVFMLFEHNQNWAFYSIYCFFILFSYFWNVLYIYDFWSFFPFNFFWLFIISVYHSDSSTALKAFTASSNKSVFPKITNLKKQICILKINQGKSLPLWALIYLLKSDISTLAEILACTTQNHY